MTNNIKRWRLLLHGDPGTGKTSLAETAVGPRLILDAEGGTDWLATETVAWDPAAGAPPTGLDKGVSVVVHTTKWHTVDQVTGFLRRGEHEFRSVILDSLTELQKQCKREIIEDKGMRIQDWGTLYDTMDPVLREIRDLTKHPTNPLWCVVITALSTVNKNDQTIPDIQGSMARSLAGQVDTIGYLRAGDMNSEGGFDREMLVDARSNVYAKDRTKLLRRGFHGVVPIQLNNETDVLHWNLAELQRYMNEQ